MLTFLRAFSDNPGKECRKSHFFNYSKNHRVWFHGKKDRPRFSKYFAIYFTSRRLVITEAEEI